MSNASKDMVGQQIGQLKVVSFSHKDTGGNYQWVCRCDCGNIRIAQGNQLRTGKVESCHQCQLKARQAKKAVEIVNHTDNDQEDIIQDFVSIITSYCARIYGLRRSRRKTEQLIEELKHE